jgi:gluconate:H+ symporter, GntP family
MTPSFYQVLFCLLGGIAVIVLLSVKYRVHPFFSLLLASFIVGLGVGFPIAEVVNAMKEGFGNIMKSLGLIVVLGTALGVLLEHNGSTKVMADTILKWIGNRYPALAMSITGFVVGLPIFCDSGFIVLSGLNLSLARRTGTKVVVMAVSMATGLYAVHCLIPPHPGAVTAAAVLEVDYGKLILIGIIAAIPAMLVGYWYASYAGKKIVVTNEREEELAIENLNKKPSAVQAFLPVVIPVILIAVKSFLITAADSPNWWQQVIAAAGDPVIALSVGVLLALSSTRPWKKESINHALQEAAHKAGGILVIIGAGGAFGAVLAATKIGQHVSEALPLEHLGLLFPFLLTAVLKTAQGSSTVAIITAAYIVQPLLPALGFHTPDSKLFCVLAMGAGSMMISHANDAYFWVIARFEKIDMQTMLKVYSVATVLMGLVTLLTVYILSLVF